MTPDRVAVKGRAFNQTLTGLAAVAPTSKGGLALAVGPAVPEVVKTLAEFVAWCEANLKRANIGTASGSSQHFADVVFNEAEVLGAQAQSAVEDGIDDDKDTVNVPAHKRAAKRGRKPLDPNLPRHVVRHELPESERVCPHDGAVLQEIGVVTSE